MSQEDTSSPEPKRARKSTLLGENVGRDYEEFSDGLGKVRLWHLGHRMSVFESTGGLVAAHSNFIIDYHRRRIEKFPRPYFAFGNWSALLAYTAEVRTSLTNWQVEMGYDELHVAHNSRLLAMSISMANAVLKSTIQVHATEEQLDDVFVRIRRAQGL